MREIIKGGFHKGFAINNRSRQTQLLKKHYLERLTMNIKTEIALGLIFTFLIIAFSQTSFAANYDTLKLGKAAFFQHSKYKGECVVSNAGPYKNANAMGIGNDKISSIKLGTHSQVVLCKDNNFKGTCKTYEKSMTSIGRMNDKTSSVIIVKTVPPKKEQKKVSIINEGDSMRCCNVGEIIHAKIAP